MFARSGFTGDRSALARSSGESPAPPAGPLPFLRRGLLLLLVAVGWAFLPAGASAETMYENDPQRELKESIEDLYGVYILNPSRRQAREKVEIDPTGKKATLWLYYDPRKPDFEKIKCEALRWILVGRFGKGGAQPFFQQHKKFETVELVLFELKSNRTVDKDGKYTVTKTPSPIAKLRLDRKKSEKHDWAAVKKKMDIGQAPDADAISACVKNGESLVSGKPLYNKDYFK